MKMKKYIVALVLALLCTVAVKPMDAQAASGSCGESSTFTYNNGVMTISGTGVVDEYMWSNTYRTGTTKLIISEGITEIGVNVFKDFTSLKQVSFPSTLKIISIGSFANCTSLKEITIPKTLTDANIYPFDGSGIEKVTFEEGITEIATGLMAGCKHLKTIYFPSTLKEIGVDAFRDCTSLATVTLPSSLEKLCSGAFRNCTSLKSITIPKGMTKSGDRVFIGSGLTTINFEPGATVVPVGLFAECKELKMINFSQSIEEIDVHAFKDCTALETVVLPYYLEKLSIGVFDGCTNLKSVTMYQNVNYIDMWCFENTAKGLTIYGKKNSYAHQYAKENGYVFAACKVPALKGITYTKGNLKYKVVKDHVNGNGTVMVTGMKKNASSVTIPKTVKLESYNYKVVKINSNAFKGKSKLKKITIKSTYLTSVGKNAIKGINKKATIKVPKSKLKAYKKLFKSKTGFKKTMKIKK